MIEIATAALLSCAEAQKIVYSMDPSYFTRTEYVELVDTVAIIAPSTCELHAGIGELTAEMRY